MITFLKEKIELAEKEDVLKLHIIIKCFQKGIHLSEADIDCLIELNKTGYGTKFYKNCIARDFYKTEQTVRNAIGKMTTLGILTYKKRGERYVNKEFLPEITNDQVLIQYIAGNLK